MILRRAFLFLCLLCLGRATLAQDGAFFIADGMPISDTDLAERLPSSFNLFDDEEPLELTIRSDFKALIKNKFNTEYQPAILEYQLDDEVLIRRQIRVKARGNTRRQICHFPPLKLDLKKTDFLIEDLQELSKMKMVSYCRQSKVFESYLLKEYLAYKMLNLLTPLSFKVRLVRMTYVDTGRNDKTLDSYALLLEPVKGMEKRLDAIELEAVKLNTKLAEQGQMALVDLFQYMIGNCDWSVPALHNVKLLKAKDHTVQAPWVIPYDFDYSGLVNAYYAVPPENLGLKSVRERLYRGFCRPEAEMEATRQRFLEKKDSLIALVENFDPLEKKFKRDLLGYVEEFYATIEQPASFKLHILKSCRTN